MHDSLILENLARYHDNPDKQRRHCKWPAAAILVPGFNRAKLPHQSPLPNHSHPSTTPQLNTSKMGNDGGSIPTRRELVKEAARNPTTTELKATQTESQSHNWSHDPLTRKPLQKPVVSDSNGKLYNKDSILEFLISGSVSNGVSAEEAEKVTLGAIKSLKDVVEVKFEIETEAKDGSAEVWKCPITAAKLGPGSKAVYLVPCGHAFSGIAIKEVLAAATTTASEEAEMCIVCDESFAPNDVIPILPIREEDIARLQLRSKRLREMGLTHSLKKAAKEKKDKKRKKKSEREIQGE